MSEKFVPLFKIWVWERSLSSDREVRDATIEYSGKLKVKASIPAIVKYYKDSTLDKTTRGLAMITRAINALIEIAHPHKAFRSDETQRTRP